MRRKRRHRARLGGRDIAIDLGTANTLVYLRGEGIRVSEPSVVAVDTRTGDVHAVGEEAQRMIGRTPASISAVRPLRHGVITDFEQTEAMLRHFIGRVHRSRFAHPRLVMCAPSGITDVERRALEEACLVAGGRSVQLIEEPMAAAIGAGLPIGDPIANVVVDIGGGTSEVAVISLGGIVVSRSLRLGGYDFDEAVATYIRRHHRLAVGETTAEAVKLEVGGVQPDASEETFQVRGRDPASGLPREAQVTSAEMREALEPLAVEIVERGQGRAGEHPARAGRRPDPARHPARRRRGAAAGLRRAPADGDPRVGVDRRRPAHLRRARRGTRARGDRRARARRALSARGGTTEIRYSPRKRMVPSVSMFTSLRKPMYAARSSPLRSPSTSWAFSSGPKLSSMKSA